MALPMCILGGPSGAGPSVAWLEVNKALSVSHHGLCLAASCRNPMTETVLTGPWSPMTGSLHMVRRENLQRVTCNNKLCGEALSLACLDISDKTNGRLVKGGLGHWGLAGVPNTSTGHGMDSRKPRREQASR